MVPLSAAVANLAIGALVLKQGMHSRLHRAFTAMALAVAVWDLDIFSLCYFSSAHDAEWWSRILRTGVCFTPVVAFHFSLTLSETTGPAWRTLLVVGYVWAAALAVINLAGLLVSGVAPHPWGWYIQPTRLYMGLTISIVVYVLLFGERIWKMYRQPSSPRQRVQAKLWLFAAVIQVPFALTNLLPLYGINTYPLGDFGNVFFVGVIAYAIARHRLMDVDYVVRKGVSFTIAAAAVLTPGGMAIEALLKISGGQEPLFGTTAAIALALVSVVLIPTLQDALETRVQRAFFPHLYDNRRRLQELARDLVHIVDESELVVRVGRSLIEVLDLDRCEIFVRDSLGRHLSLMFPTGRNTTVEADDLHQLEQLDEPVLASEVESKSIGPVRVFKTHRWEVGVPLRINDRLTGFIALGQRRDFRIFSSEDLQLLATVAGGATVALENAHLSRQLRRSEAVLERANRLSSLGMLAAGIAHEIRNPLVAVKTFLDLLPQRLDDREFLTHFRDLSLSELRRVTDLIADLLTLGKSRTAERRSVELLATLEPVIRLMESTAKKRQIDVVVEGDATLPAISADPDQLKQIALNLILNAIESSPAGGRVTVDARAGARLGPSAAVVVEVRDQGPGIPPDQLENIFHPFFTTKETGTGLGLALVHQMVVDHGGEIAVDSVPGRGTTFRVTLPVAQAELRRTGT